jgi:hypothetical protein
LSKRLRSDIWVSAYLKRVHVQGGFAVVARKGEAQAGAIFLKVENLRTGQLQLFTPASQSEINTPYARYFTCVVTDISAQNLTERLAREVKRDSDLWIIAVESQAGAHFLLPEEIIL